jgi:hypothetical protein
MGVNIYACAAQKISTAKFVTDGTGDCSVKPLPPFFLLLTLKYPCHFDCTFLGTAILTILLYEKRNISKSFDRTVLKFHMYVALTYMHRLNQQYLHNPF